ncbi:MAG: hypothetical protein HY721_03460 [Planctomycetes bacterium]|nr:hypothetical protein [Planctomycetota bacterium]
MDANATVRSWTTGALPVLTLVAAYVLVEAYLVYWTVCPARDGARYLTYALRLEEEPWIDVVRTSVDHPGYPFLLHATFGAARALGIESPAARVALAQAATAVAGLLLVLAAFAAARRLWGLVPAWAGTLAFLLLPRPAEHMGDVLSDPLHALLWVLAAALVLRGLEDLPARAGGRASLFGLAGLAAGFAYWVRADALTLPAAVVALAGVLALAGTKLGAPRLLCGIRAAVPAAAFLATFGACLALFVAAVGKWSPKPSAEDLILGLAAPPALAGPVIASAALPAAATGAAQSAWHVLKDLAQELRFVHAATAALALVLALRASRPRPGAAFLALTFAAYLAATSVLEARSGYTTGRYFLPLLPFIASFGMAGLEAAGRLWLRSPAAPRWLVGAGLAASLACSVPSLLKEGLHENAHGRLEAARWIAARIEPGDTVCDPYFFPSYLAGLRGRTAPSAAPPPGSRAHYVIAEDRHAAKVKGLGALLEEKRAERVAEFPRRPGESERAAVYLVRG